MANRQRKVSKKGSNFEAVESVNDHLLPSAKELKELKEIDESLIPFLMERAEIEQNKRHQQNDEMVMLNKREQGFVHYIRYLALLLGFFIIAGSMFMSYMLIINNHVIAGSIFTGIGLLYVAYLFVSVANKNASPPK